MEKKILLNNLKEKQRQYDFSLIEETFKYNAKLEVICHSKDSLGREHGVFNTTYGHILRGDGCPKCSGKYMDKELFVHEAKLIHGDNCSYEDSLFRGKKKKMQIYCNIHNLYFPQTPEKHLLGHSCPKCRYEKASKAKMKSLEKFIEQSNAVHNGKYDTSKAVYKGNDVPLTLICHEKYENGIEHGEFEITPANHLHKTSPQGCPICGRISSALSRVKPFEEYEKEANHIHNNKYIYIKDTYVGASGIVDIICPIHGLFHQKGTDHTCLKQGCPKCSNQMSIAEEEICNFLRDTIHLTQIERRNRSIISPQELDVIILSHNIAIEFNGLIWHSTKFNKEKQYHLTKTEECLNKGINLIHIFEDEWNFKRDIVKSMLRDALELYEETIDSNSCSVREISTSVARDFLNTNNINGYKKSKYKYGIYTDSGELVSVITFGYYNKEIDSYDIISFSNKLNTSVINALRTLISYFTDQHTVSVLKVVSDRRFCANKQFANIGFKHVEYTKPNKFYIDDKNRVTKKPIGDGKYSEIYDCGVEIMEMDIS